MCRKIAAVFSGCGIGSIVVLSEVLLCPFVQVKHPSVVIAPEEPFDLYEIELSDEDADLTAAE